MTVPHSLRAIARAIAALSLVLLLMLLGGGSALAAGSPAITLGKDAPATVLFGTDSTVSLHATNPLGEAYGYNLTFRDVLPAGISYVAGSAPFEPTTTIANAPGPGQTTLIWENVGDLSPGSDYSFAYKVRHSTTAYAVGDTYTNQAGAFIQTDPRLVPKFNADGTPIPASSTGSAAASATTRITAVKIDKSEPSPEGELLRGVHDHQTTYTLKVTNNNVNPTDTVFVDDYLPAGLEFLQCGGIDHTTDAPTNPGSPQEYPGSGSLIPGTVLPPAECPAPELVQTVNVSPDGVLPAAIYTHVRWSLADLAPGAVQTIKYRAAIPIRENTLDWNGAGPLNGIAPPSACTAGVCEQAANLDNNSGPETFDEQALTNVAQVSGLYRGIEQVSDQTTLTRTAEDLAVQKSVTPTSIAEGDLSTWTLNLQTGEYRTLQDIHVSDTLPNGLCPLGDSLLGGPGDFNHEGFPQSPECNNVSDAQPSDPYTSVTENSDGTYAIGWDSSSAPGLAQMDPSTTLQITFPTRTRSHYQSNFLDAAPVLNYDSWTNHVTVSGPNFVITDTNGDLIDHDGPDSGPTTDVSSATQTAGGPSIDKQVASPTGLNPVSCAGVYLNTIASSYGPGDIVCWQLTVNFAAGVHAKDSVVSDFLPTGSQYVAGSQAVTGASTAPGDQLRRLQQRHRLLEARRRQRLRRSRRRLPGALRLAHHRPRGRLRGRQGQPHEVLRREHGGQDVPAARRGELRDHEARARPDEGRAGRRRHQRSRRPDGRRQRQRRRRRDLPRRRDEHRRPRRRRPRTSGTGSPSRSPARTSRTSPMAASAPPGSSSGPASARSRPGRRRR